MLRNKIAAVVATLLMCSVAFAKSEKAAPNPPTLDDWEKEDARLDAGLERTPKHRGNLRRGLASEEMPKAVEKEEYEKESTEPLIGEVKIFESPFLKRTTFWGEKRPALGRRVHEREKLFTVAHEWAEIRLNDGTELRMGPSTQAHFKNWTQRNGDNRLIRVIYVRSGFVWLKVNKTYSQLEPFMIESPLGVTAVRGTEFVVEVSENELPKGVRKDLKTLKKDDRTLHFDEIEVHTLAGEVAFAKNRDALWREKDRVILGPGKSSVARKSLDRPQQPRRFDVRLFTQYLERVFPSSTVALDKRLTNEPRAKLAAGIDVPALATNNRAIASVPSEEEKARLQLQSIRTRRDHEKWLSKKKKSWDSW